MRRIVFWLFFWLSTNSFAASLGRPIPPADFDQMPRVLKEEILTFQTPDERNELLSAESLFDGVEKGRLDLLEPFVLRQCEGLQKFFNLELSLSCSEILKELKAFSPRYYQKNLVNLNRHLKTVFLCNRDGKAISDWALKMHSCEKCCLRTSTHVDAFGSAMLICGTCGSCCLILASGAQNGTLPIGEGISGIDEYCYECVCATCGLFCCSAGVVAGFDVAKQQLERELKAARLKDPDFNRIEMLGGKSEVLRKRGDLKTAPREYELILDSEISGGPATYNYAELMGRQQNLMKSLSTLLLGARIEFVNPPSEESSHVKQE